MNEFTRLHVKLHAYLSQLPRLTQQLNNSTQVDRKRRLAKFYPVNSFEYIVQTLSLYRLSVKENTESQLNFCNFCLQNSAFSIISLGDLNTLSFNNLYVCKEALCLRAS
jgi:hypothetical protein